MPNFNEMSNEELIAISKEIQEIVQVRVRDYWSTINIALRKITRLKREVIPEPNTAYIDIEIDACKQDIKNAERQIAILEVSHRDARSELLAACKKRVQ